MKIILISGKAQHGKDTVALAIQKKLKKDGKNVLVTHYADLLKFICTNYFGWNGKKDEAGRQLLQYVGTDIIRKQNPSLWVDFVGTMLTYFHSNWDYVIIPDCRFPNEIEEMRKYFPSAMHIRVSRENFESSLTEEQKNHISETALDDYPVDWQFMNDCKLEDIDARIEDWVEDALYE